MLATATFEEDERVEELARTALEDEMNEELTIAACELVLLASLELLIIGDALLEDEIADEEAMTLLDELRIDKLDETTEDEEFGTIIEVAVVQDTP